MDWTVSTKIHVKGLTWNVMYLEIEPFEDII